MLVNSGGLLGWMAKYYYYYQSLKEQESLYYVKPKGLDVTLVFYYGINHAKRKTVANKVEGEGSDLSDFYIRRTRTLPYI